ncbi:MAG: hypothetical protein ACFB0Z_01915 [Candidatus Phaeomarinobacter sp.]
MKDQEKPGQLQVQLFGAALGLAGLMLAWQHAEIAFVVAPSPVPETLLAVAFFVSTLVFILYTKSAIDHRPRAETPLGTPPTLVALASGSMALMQLSAGVVVLLPLWQPASSALWLVGVGGYFVCAALFCVAVGRVRPTLDAVTPAWFIPTVGMAVAPSAGVALGFTSLAAGMAIVGTVAWVALLPVVAWRLVSQGPLASPMLPSLCVLIAPAALISSAIRTFDGPSDAATLFFYVSVAFALLVLVMLVARRSDIRDVGFSFAWWSATFPLAALAGAAQLTLAAAPTAGHLLAAQMSLGLASMVTAVIGVMTLRLIIRRRWR